jgi:hypothetical protein
MEFVEQINKLHDAGVLSIILAVAATAIWLALHWPRKKK